MVTKKSDRFANQICLALYGESIDEKIKKEKIMEKTLIIQNLIELNKLSVKQISLVVNETEEFVLKIKEMSSKK